MKIPLSAAIASEIELRLARFSRGWETLDPLHRATAFKVLVLSEMLGGRKKAAEAADISDNTLDNYRHGKKDPTFAKLELMAEKAGIASRYLGGDWFFERDAIRIDLSGPASTAGAMPPGMMDNPAQPYVHGFDEIRPSSLAAGIIEAYWARLGLEPSTVTTLVAEGDSMVPTIVDQAPVFVDTADRSLADGGVYAFNAEGRLIIRRIQRLLGGGLQLLADNGETYPPQAIDEQKLSGLDVVGRVRSAAVAF